MAKVVNVYLTGFIIAKLKKCFLYRNDLCVFVLSASSNPLLNSHVGPLLHEGHMCSRETSTRFQGETSKWTNE